MRDITFPHERLDVYRASIDFLALSDEVAGSFPKGRAYLGDQLRRAASSIALNIAEATGEFAAAEKARFYRMARRSATECVAILDVSRAIGVVRDTQFHAGRALLHRTVSMLTAMVLKLRREERGSVNEHEGIEHGSGSNTNTGTNTGTRPEPESEPDPDITG